MSEGNLQCPFCGGDSYGFTTRYGEQWGSVECGCGAMGPAVCTGYKNKDYWRAAAIAAWHTRKEESNG